MHSMFAHCLLFTQTLGSGASGCVRRAINTHTQQEVAVKEVHFVEDESTMQEFRTECKLMYVDHAAELLSN